MLSQFGSSIATAIEAKWQHLTARSLGVINDLMTGKVRGTAQELDTKSCVDE